MVCGKLTVILGGVRSGKSAYAEKLLLQKALPTTHRLVYIASGMRTDPEMESRINKHRLDRSAHQWLTLEQPVKLEEVLPLLKKNDFVLWDCVTTWLANELYEGWENGSPCIAVNGCMEEKYRQLFQTIDSLLEIVSHLVIVSNEVLDERLHQSEESQLFSKWIGEVHQELVMKSDTAIEMDYGLPIFWKHEGEGEFK